MTTSDESRSQEHVLAVLQRTAARHALVPIDLVKKVIEHEAAVQFDEKRFEAINYIRSLAFEHLEAET